MRKFVAPLLLLLSLVCSGPILARERNPFATAADINLSMLLAPPAADNSAP
jgi:hypothetical protein